ncbi:MAG: phosphoribosylformylglycinamidine cyclo-ligase [Spirochaetaceae bacterium]|jgi:phosphoribosylformylglycinamidine cyclo-ligase|nr:phosphoribosylformylglycinamidine cyclo-ligase [Spirochaetaceae bacterium]
MKGSTSAPYKAAGVDITAGYRAVDLLKQHVERARTPGFLGGLGGFGGLFELDLAGTDEPVLVSGADGVGTKLRVAFLSDRHTSIGIDCVAMCVNDIICSLARPLFFLDYIACGKTKPEKIAAIVEGVADGCVQAGCALVGGETAEMPGFYGDDEYDLAGFAVGIVSKSALPDPARIAPGDAVIALPSSGLHSNGFSLVREVFGLNDPCAGPHSARRHLAGSTERLGRPLGDVLLTPTRIYVQPMLALARALAQEGGVLGAAHITGGGFYENMPRCLPEGCCICVQDTGAHVPAIFGLIEEQGAIGRRDMFNTFNMGVGMIAVVREGDAEKALAVLCAAGEAAWMLGHVDAGERGVHIAGVD